MLHEEIASRLKTVKFTINMPSRRHNITNGNDPGASIRRLGRIQDDVRTSGTMLTIMMVHFWMDRDPRFRNHFQAQEIPLHLMYGNVDEEACDEFRLALVNWRNEVRQGMPTHLYCMRSEHDFCVECIHSKCVEDMYKISTLIEVKCRRSASTDAGIVIGNIAWRITTYKQMFQLCQQRYRLIVCYYTHVCDETEEEEMVEGERSVTTNCRNCNFFMRRIDSMRRKIGRLRYNIASRGRDTTSDSSSSEAEEMANTEE